MIAGADGARLDFEVAPAGFWQVHPAAAQTFAAAVLHELAPRPGETVLDLYAGAGLFTAVLAHAVGPDGTGRRHRVRPAGRGRREREPGRPAAGPRSGRRGSRRALLEALDLEPDLIVLDPPRSGAGAAVMARGARSRRPGRRLCGVRPGVAGPRRADGDRARLGDARACRHMTHSR